MFDGRFASAIGCSSIAVSSAFLSAFRSGSTTVTVSVAVLESAAETPPVCVHLMLWSVEPSLIVTTAFAVTVAPGVGVPVTETVTDTGGVAPAANAANTNSMIAAIPRTLADFIAPPQYLDSLNGGRRRRRYAAN